MFKNIMDDTQLQKRIFEENVKDKFGESISNDLFREVEIRVDNMQDAYNLSENQSEQIRTKLLELRSIT
ncbi:hypothetical protein O3935_02575 [Leptotrichia wadei]|jgi:hypothetical protein|uniref:hypothetical protein n=1 Tax=Leptotrichia wadei TaxID=157687 RepID=UPI00352DFF9E